MKRTAENTLRACLAGLCILFSGYILFEFGKGYTLESNVTPEETAVTGDMSQTMLQQNAADFDEISSRPLFNPDRRPDEDNISVAAVQQPLNTPARDLQPQELGLSAVILTRDTRIALLQQGNDPKLVKLTEGEHVDDWVLEEIRSDSITLRKGSETRILELVIKKSPAMAPRNQANRNRPLQGNRRSPARLLPAAAPALPVEEAPAPDPAADENTIITE
jgi:hypothetical protein